jgi:hypothetical protein
MGFFPVTTQVSGFRQSTGGGAIVLAILPHGRLGAAAIMQSQRKIIRQDLQDCAGSHFLPESADEKHVNPVNPV